MSQSSLWQIQSDNSAFAELCNGLYQREIAILAKGDFSSAGAVQARLKSLSYYITRTAHAMTQVSNQGQSPLVLDSQNASWSAKQSKLMPLSGQVTLQETEKANDWYLQKDVYIGLVVPVLLDDHIIIDCVDRIDVQGKRIRTNIGGWFSLTAKSSEEVLLASNPNLPPEKRLLKPNRKIMSAACAGHCWQGSAKQRPIIPSLRELLLSCSINWKNFKKPLAI